MTRHKQVQHFGIRNGIWLKERSSKFMKRCSVDFIVEVHENMHAQRQNMKQSIIHLSAS